MSVDTHIPRRACQTLVFSVRYVFMCLKVDKPFRETKVYYVYRAVLFA